LLETNVKTKVYAVKHKDDIIRNTSTSGGIFTALSDFVLNQNGVIYGAAFVEDLKVEHIRATTAEERNRFRGSKYVQSEINNIFQMIKKDLLNKKNVLFSGTPCQVAGLKYYLKNLSDSEHLILVDVICHGVPSPKIFEEHIQKLSEIKQVKHYSFRDKKEGWHKHVEEVSFIDGITDNKTKLSQSYKKYFQQDLMNRESCYNCPFANMKRVSDVTIGDYWGIEKIFPKFDDNKGISLCLIHTEKGQIIFNRIKEDIEYIESNTTDCLQPQLEYSTKMPLNYDLFWNDYFKFGYNLILKKYTSVRLSRKIKNKIGRLLRKLRLTK